MGDERQYRPGDLDGNASMAATGDGLGILVFDRARLQLTYHEFPLQRAMLHGNAALGRVWLADAFRYRSGALDLGTNLVEQALMSAPVAL